jgi:ribosomal protein L4
MLLKKKNNSALVVNSEMDVNNIRSFSNFSNIKTEEARKINPLDLLNYKFLVVINPKDSIELLSNKLNK